MQDCDNRNGDGSCEIVKLLSGPTRLHFVPAHNVCAACCDSPTNPKSINHVTCSVTTSELHRVNKFNAAIHSTLLQCLQYEIPQYGPGSVLEELLDRIGFRPDNSCNCAAYKDQMNLWGNRCLDHIDEIVSWLKENAAKTEHALLPPTIVRLLSNDMLLSRIVRYCVWRANHSRQHSQT